MEAILGTTTSVPDEALHIAGRQPIGAISGFASDIIRPDFVGLNVRCTASQAVNHSCGFEEECETRSAPSPTMGDLWCTNLVRPHLRQVGHPVNENEEEDYKVYSAGRTSISRNG